MHLIPLFGAVLAIVFLGEQLHIYHFAGFALILAGVWLATRHRRRSISNRNDVKVRRVYRIDCPCIYDRSKQFRAAKSRYA